MKPPDDTAHCMMAISSRVLEFVEWTQFDNMNESVAASVTYRVSTEESPTPLMEPFLLGPIPWTLAHWRLCVRTAAGNWSCKYRTWQDRDGDCENAKDVELLKLHCG